DDDVEAAVGLGQHQRLTNDGLERLIAEIIVDGTLVDDDISLAGDQTNASDRLFSPAYGMEANLRHFPSSSLLQLVFHGLLSLMGVLGAGIGVQLLEHRVA